MSSFEIFTGIFGGLGLFLYGMKLMSDGLENIAGEKQQLFKVLVQLLLW